MAMLHALLKLISSSFSNGKIKRTNICKWGMETYFPLNEVHLWTFVLFNHKLHYDQFIEKQDLYNLAKCISV